MANRKPISLYKTVSDINIDVAYLKIHPNIVSEYEAMEACIFGNYTWEVFQALPVDRQAECIAQYRSHSRVDSVVQSEITLYHKYNKKT